MIVCDAEHLGFLDAATRRNAFGRQLQSFEADLGIEGIGDEPLRAVFIRAPWIERHGPEVEVLASYEGHPVAVREGAVLACSLPPGADRRPPLSRALHGDDHERPRAGGEEGGEMRDPRAGRAGEDPGRLLDRGQGGRGRLDRRRERRRAAAAGRLRGGAEGRRPSGPQRRPRGPDRGLLQARLATPSWNGSLPLPSGWSTTPTCGSRSAPAPTPASSRECRRSARPCASRSPAT